MRRLVSSGMCDAEDAESHARELRRSAEDLGKSAAFESRARLLKALGNPTRLRMIRLLAEREMCVCEVMVALELTQPTASHHLTILERHGVIVRQRSGKWVHYRLSPTAAAALVDASGLPKVRIVHRQARASRTTA
jgi:DNA-binding transcriptional ArsR family regulator